MGLTAELWKLMQTRKCERLRRETVKRGRESWEELPLYGAYFPAAEQRSGAALRGATFCWRTAQFEPLYSLQNSTLAIPGGSVSEGKGKRGK